VHSLLRLQSLQVRFSQYGVDAASVDGEQLRDHADCGAGPDSAPAGLASGRVVVGDEPSASSGLQQGNARRLTQVIKRGVSTASGNVALNARGGEDQLVVGYLDGCADPCRRPVRGASCLRMRRASTTLAQQFRVRCPYPPSGTRVAAAEDCGNGLAVGQVDDGASI
jgi:hypothetical protein